MTNGEKYKTAKERAEAFWQWHTGANLPYYAVEAFAHWLELEAEEEEPLPCPFCGRIPDVITPYSGSRRLACVTCMCGYHSVVSKVDTVIAAHNRVARAAAKEKEANS